MRVPESALKKFIPVSIEENIFSEDMSRLGLLVDEVIPYDDDRVYLFEMPAHRGDVLSVLGVAREIRARYRIPFIDYPDKMNLPPKEGDISIDSRYCRSYHLLEIEGLSIKDSSDFLKESLEKMGMKSINNVVDCTNYILMMWGQPLHAFDADCVDVESLHVRDAQDGEEFLALNDETYTLKPGMPVIADKNQVHALAGIIGGKDSEVTSKTERIVLEVAYFEPLPLRQVVCDTGLRTEAAERFMERG